MYKCNRCGSVFDEPETIETTGESYYGVADMFPDRHTMYYDACPYCNDTDYESVMEEDE